MQVIGPLNQRTQESFPIAGELYGWCSSVTAEDLAPGSIGRGIFDAETRGDIPARLRGAHHPPVPRGRRRHDHRLDREHHCAVRPPPRAVRAGPGEPGTRSGSLRRGAALLGSGPHLGPQGNPRRGDRRRDDSCRRPGGHPLWCRQPRPAALREPDTFDVLRNPVDHLSFGYGPHGCAGQGLAKLEAHAIIEALARRVKTLTISRRGPGTEQHHAEHREAPGRQGGGSMRIELDRPRCEGHGLCEEAAPALMHLDDDGELVHRCPGGGRGGAGRREGGGTGLPGRRAAIGRGMTMRRIVVVGNGIAGLTACDSLRSAGFDGELTVVGAERHHPYSRPALSKALLHGVDGNVTSPAGPRAAPSRPTKRPSCSASAPRAWTSTPGWSAWTGAVSCRMTAWSSPPVPGRSASRRDRGHGRSAPGSSPCAPSRTRSSSRNASHRGPRSS